MHRLAKSLIVVLFACGGSPILATEGVERSVVRIVNYAQRGDAYSPWDVTDVFEVSGSGFVIDDGLIMTNAHVVSDSRLLLVRAHNDPEPRVARTIHIAHDCDLAVIRPEDPAALEGIPPLSFGGMPELASVVDTLGYPLGGTQVSSTRGVVSRIEEELYVHSGVDVHLTVQTDAAINPGNSGGPVVQNGLAIGVAFQANLQAENVGFFIPTEVIGRFLRDIEDGRYDGYPELGTDTSGMENPAARAQAGMQAGQSGVRVDTVYRSTSADGLLQEGDILLQVEGRPVANDGSVADGDMRIPFGLLVDRKQIGEEVTLGILRQGRRLERRIPLAVAPRVAVLANLYDQTPRYFIYAGLVFVTLDREMLKTFGENWFRDADVGLLYEQFLRPVVEPDRALEERVVLLRRLDHPVNADMAWFRNEAVERVNGTRITSLEVLVETLEANEGAYHVLEFSHYRRFGVLDRRKAEAANEEILQRYGITEDRHL